MFNVIDPLLYFMISLIVEGWGIKEAVGYLV